MNKAAKIIDQIFEVGPKACVDCGCVLSSAEMARKPLKRGHKCDDCYNQPAGVDTDWKRGDPEPDEHGISRGFKERGLSKRQVTKVGSGRINPAWRKAWDRGENV